MSASKHSVEEKLRLVEEVKKMNGVIPRSLARDNHISRTQILSWYNLYEEFGIEGLEKGTNQRRPYKIKASAVRDVIENNLTLQQVVRKYKLRVTTLENWIRLVRRRGYEALRPQKVKQRSMGRPKKGGPRTELEKLKEENLRLRAENDLLKKVKALVETKNRLKQENGL